jgi:hypothetical protein
MHATISGKPVLRATICMPRTGLWTADIEADSEMPMSGAMTLELGEGVLELRGVVASGGVSGGRWHARLVGGSGGLGRRLAARSYRGAPLLLILTDLLAEAGEQLSSSATDSVWLATVPQFWARAEGPAARTLHALCEAAGAVWRALPDGSIWAGVESWPAFTGAYETTSERPREDAIEIASESVLLPGMLLDARRVSLVQLTLGRARFRTTAWLEA